MANGPFFPNLFPENDPIPPHSALTQKDAELSIKTLVEIAAACALEGDMEMARAFTKASTEIVAVAMARWPKKFADSESEATEPANQPASSTETEMQSQENNGGDPVETIQDPAPTTESTDTGNDTQPAGEAGTAEPEAEPQAE